MHFTYTKSPDVHDLHQGDVLERTDAIQRILSEVHPHYLQEGYKYYIILTQSCDLARRGCATPSARYISIAAVRSLKTALERKLYELLQYPFEKSLGCGSESIRGKLTLFLERLHNNNEASYFYLHQEPAGKLMEDYCAFLHLSVALKSELHYDALLSSKILQLSEPFQHKLGHIVGNLYSRVGTEDWVPNTLSKIDFDRRISSIVSDDELAFWVEDKIYQYVIKAFKDKKEGEVSEEDLDEVIREAKKTEKARRNAVLDEIKGELMKFGIDEKQAGKASSRINGAPNFSQLFK